MPTNEQVLVIAESHFRAIGYFEGFSAVSEATAQRLLDARHFQYRSRLAVETDPAWKQLIPYVVLTCAGQVFHYRRGSQSGESRLRRLRSIGIGGHITAEDAAGSPDPYQRGLERELEEEVEHAEIVRRHLVGMIYDPRTPVGSVHLGIVHYFELRKPVVRPRDAALIESGFAPLSALQAAAADFESWSQFTLNALRVTTNPAS